MSDSQMSSREENPLVSKLSDLGIFLSCLEQRVLQLKERTAPVCVLEESGSPKDAKSGVQAMCAVEHELAEAIARIQRFDDTLCGILERMRL